MIALNKAFPTGIWLRRNVGGGFMRGGRFVKFNYAGQSDIAGLFHGYGALCDGLVAAMKRRHAPGAKVIATGGHAPMIAPFCRSIRIINPDLTLQGLRLIYQKSC